MNVLLMSLMAPPSASSSQNTPIFNILVGLAIVVIILIVIRELVVRYWKINEIINNQEKTNLLLKKYFESKGIEFTDKEKARLKS
jgi:hypothetical protein